MSMEYALGIVEDVVLFQKIVKDMNDIKNLKELRKYKIPVESK